VEVVLPSTTTTTTTTALSGVTSLYFHCNTPFLVHVEFSYCLLHLLHRNPNSSYLRCPVSFLSPHTYF
jgi:hypothetical protein